MFALNGQGRAALTWLRDPRAGPNEDGPDRTEPGGKMNPCRPLKCIRLCYVFELTNFYVFVVASELTCSMNVSLPGNSVHESDFVEINCTTEYRGSGMPVVSCRPTLQVSVQFVLKTFRSFQRVSYVGTLAAADIGDRTVIRCETKFVLPKRVTAAPQQVQSVLDTPRYHHTWLSTPIRVFNTTGNANIQF